MQEVARAQDGGGHMGLPDTPFLRNVRPSQHFTRAGPRSPGSARPARLVLPNGAALEISNEARELDHVELAVGRVVVLEHDLMRDVIRGHQRPSGAISGHLEAIRGHLEAIRGHLEAIGGHSEAIGGRVEDTQRYNQVVRRRGCHTAAASASEAAKP